MSKLSFILKQTIRSEVESILKKVQSKALFIHEDLVELLHFVYDFKLNSLVPKDKVVIFENDTEAYEDFKDANNLIFLLNPVTTAIKTINSIVLRNENKAIYKRYIVYFVPKVDCFVLDEIARVNLTKKIEVNSFNFGLIAFNPGLISLELNHCTHPVQVVNLSVEALLKISKLSGRFSKIIGKGERAKTILQQYERLVAEEDSIVENQSSCLIVIERKMDPITPLLTGHSYQALLDHFFGIKYNRIEVPQRLLGGVTDLPQKYLLHNQRDPVYEEVAYLCIQQARDQIEKRSAQIKQRFQFVRMNRKVEDEDKKGEIEVNRVRVQYEQIQNHRQIIQEIIDRMNQLHCYNLIKTQAQILDQGKADFEDFHFLTLEYPPELLLRLICLYSQVYINANFYSRYQKEILEVIANNYSPTHISSLYLLQKAGLLKNSKLRNKWQQLKMQLQLFPDDPHSYTQVHITYSALCVRFIELVLKGKLTPELSSLFGKDNFIRIERDREVKQVYVFYVGGITYSEISCLRLLQKELKIKINILTTNVSNGKDMIKRIIINPDI